MTLPDFELPRGLVMVVAVARGGAIGRAGSLPWQAPEDLAHFRRVTMGHSVILGSVTWRSIGRALPGRHLVVVSRQALKLPAKDVSLVSSPEDAVELARRTDPSPIVAGGAALYATLLPRVGRIFLTEIDVEVPDADAFLAASTFDGFAEVTSWTGTDPRLTFRVLDRLVRQAADAL